MGIFQQLVFIFKTRKWLWGVVLGIIASTAIITYQFGLKNTDKKNLQSFLPSFSLPTENKDIKDKKTLTILLLGYGGAGHQGGFLSDVIQVVHMNFETKKVALISIPRDLWVAISGGTENKINAAYNIDQQKNDEKATISRTMAGTIIGFPIDYYIAVDFVGFQRIIGQELGGIDVEVSEILDDSWYPIKGEELNTCGKTAEEVAQLSANFSGFELEKQFTCRYEHLYYPAGTVHMEGGDALKFVRSRHGSVGGDFSRSKRQHEVLLAIKEKLFSLEGIDNIPAVFREFATHTKTDLNAEIAEYLWPLLKATREYVLVPITLSMENVFTSGKSNQGAYIITPRNSWEEVHVYIQQQIEKAN